MIRLNWLITLLFFVPCTMSNNYVTPHTSFRPCDDYNRCRRGYTPVDVLPANSSMGYDASLTSNETSFTTGFFVLGNNSYLGTWYTMSDDMIVVWVANRDNPIPSQTSQNCSLVLGKDGNAAIVVLDSENHYYSYWSTAYSATSNPAMTYLQLLDNGNLVLREKGDEGGKYLWQSFEHPTDTFLPGMNISQGSLNFISWKSPEDPAEGHFLLKILLKNMQGDASLIDLLMYDTDTSYNSAPLWYSILSSLDPILNTLQVYPSRRLVMNETGRLQLWELENNKWSMLWAAPKDQCDFYDPCGSFGVCDAGTSLKCKCLPGYQPNDPVNWDSKIFSSGCSKKTNDQCGGIFYSLPMVKLPSDPIIMKPGNEIHCRNTCLNSCGCKGYSFDADQYGCLIWRDELKRIEEEYNDVANAGSLYVRISHSDIESSSRSCNICGTNVIPYPLSTNGSCGDPTYFNFFCNDTNGQLYFIPPNGKAYKVSNINPDQRKFTLQLTNNIDQSTELNLNNSSPFKLTTWNTVGLMDRTVTEVEVSWKPPLQPTCNSSADCKDWPETSCGLDADGEKVCMCVDGFQWDSLSMNCSKDEFMQLVHHKPLPLLVKVGIASGTVLFLLSGISFVIHLQRRKVTPRAGIVDQFKTDDIEDTEIPLVDYQSILAATDNFSDANKLGAGGFGPVYKGVLVDGNEVAVKRLSAASVQGVQEFRNEIILIAKLQHRNLVRVLGYCISEDEKILIYEYMPNKSLDSCLFDRTMPCLLDWTKRFNIILGIARGLLYLHEDSRLRIIHRDLKPSNILLDEELNPKISDFGLAKIIAGNDMATNTARVVGTYGYMSPEYALEGYFSVKSDVYSFGIIVFEVISGKRCTSLLPLENNLINLLGYAWDLWKQEKELELVDKSIIDTCDSFQVKRFINVALLCVQENPSDRPTMSSALLMLGGDNMNLPYPKQPVFVARRQPSVTNSSSKFGTSMGSNVELTNTLEGR